MFEVYYGLLSQINGHCFFHHEDNIHHHIQLIIKFQESIFFNAPPWTKKQNTKSTTKCEQIIMRDVNFHHIHPNIWVSNIFIKLGQFSTFLDLHPLDLLGFRSVETSESNLISLVAWLFDIIELQKLTKAIMFVDCKSVCRLVLEEVCWEISGLYV